VLREENPRRDELEAMKAEIQELKIELVLCKMSIANGTMPMRAVPKVEVSNPKKFKGGEQFRVEHGAILWRCQHPRQDDQCKNRFDVSNRYYNAVVA